MKPIGRIALAVILTSVVAGCARSGPPAPIVDRTLTYDDLLAAAGRAASEVGERIADAAHRVVAEVAPEPRRASPAPQPADTQIASASPPERVAVAPLPDLEPVATPVSVNAPPPQPTATAAHQVVPGDTVYAVARQYGVEPDALITANGLRQPYVLRVGDTLKLPGGGVTVTPTVQPTRLAAVPTPKPVVATAAAVPHPKARPLPQPRPTGPVFASVGPSPRVPPAAPPRATAVAHTGPVGAPPPRAGGDFAWPVEGPLLASFGALDGGRHNDGLNISAPRGTPVRAAENGVVVYAGNEIRGFGNLVLLKHAGGIITAYAHNDALLVGRGDVVDRGAAIARVGRSGGVTEPQLHFEIRRGTEAVDPRPLLARQEIAAR